MGTGRSKSGTCVIESGRLIRDAVANVLPRDLAGQVVERALASAGTATVPSSHEGLVVFVRVHLVPACRASAGPESARALSSLLDSVLLGASSMDDAVDIGVSGPTRLRRVR